MVELLANYPFGGYAVAQLAEALQPGWSRVRYPIVLLGCFIDLITCGTGVDSDLITCGTGVDSDANRNEYMGYLLGVNEASS